MAEAHELTGATQLSYPGGKDGYWVVRCTCGYTSGPRFRLGSANRSAIEHLVATRG